MKRYVHIVWSAATGPIAAYTDPSMAHSHARTILGVDVQGCPVRDSLPDIVLDDLNSDFDGDDDTPVVIDVELEAIPEAIHDSGRPGSEPTEPSGGQGQDG